MGSWWSAGARVTVRPRRHAGLPYNDAGGGAVTVTQYVYEFAEGNKDQRDLLGGKGANLAEMTRLGLPVPPGFTITTEACRSYLAAGHEPPELRVNVTAALRGLEDRLDRRLGDRHDPLLVSVRSGAKFSMPGMMETVLNIGLNDASVLGLAEASGDERFAWDSYRRLIMMFGKTVLLMDGDLFSSELDERRSTRASRPTWTWRQRTCKPSCSATRTWCVSTRDMTSHSTRASSSTSPSGRCSTPGTPTVHASIAGGSGSPTVSAPP